jgi:methylmalonyl-CoA/ethylmalonyl-CoA epimerase
MGHTAENLPVGLAGLRYGISQVSLAVEDIDALVPIYHRAFGWAPWKVFDHVEPMHHNTERLGVKEPYSLRGAEVQVGSLNFELLQPLSGRNVWSEFLAEHGEGIASIATMFLTRPEGDAVKVAFKEAFGLDVILRAEIGDHIEYYYLDTQEKFGMLIESGSGHAIDFVSATYEYPSADATLGPAPSTGITYPLTQVSAVVRDLDAKVRAYHEAFGWGPWRIYDSTETGVQHDVHWEGEDGNLPMRWAETMVGDMSFELIEPLGPSPWQAFLDGRGEGLCSVSVGLNTKEDVARTVSQLQTDGGKVAASGRIGSDVEWYLLDLEPTLKCWIKTGIGVGRLSDAPHTVYP